MKLTALLLMLLCLLFAEHSELVPGRSGNGTAKPEPCIPADSARELYGDVKDFAVTLFKGNLPDSLKKMIFYNKVKGFVTKHPGHSVNAAVIRYGGILSEEQVKELSRLDDRPPSHSAGIGCQEPLQK